MLKIGGRKFGLHDELGKENRLLRTRLSRSHDVMVVTMNKNQLSN
jgi:hypothetical protein